MNQQGNSTLFSMLFLLLFTLLSLKNLQYRIDNSKKAQSSQKLILCAKEHNGETKKLISFMKKTNMTLKVLSLSKLAQVVLPGFGILTKISTKSAIKLLIKAQEIQLISYLNKTRSLYSKSCLISPTVFKTPYKLSISKLGFQRNKWKQAKLRGYKWSSTFFGVSYIIQNDFHLSSKVKIKSKTIKKDFLF